ncbi:MAG: suppressor of fused domain protein [Candidatus Xenobiia bacterium LiM19]
MVKHDSMSHNSDEPERKKSVENDPGDFESVLDSVFMGSKEKYMPSEVFPVPCLEKMLDHIGRYIGDPETTLHEITSTIVHIDVHYIPPQKERDFATLVTSGMSDKPMITPPGAEEYRYAELMMYLPPTWPVDQEHSKIEEYYWPVRLLFRLGRIPHFFETWFGPWHTIGNGDPPERFAADTTMCASILLHPLLESKGFWKLEVSPEKTINYFLAFPLYEEEMRFKLHHGVERLIEKLRRKGIDLVVDIDRENVCREKDGKKRGWI